MPSERATVFERTQLGPEVDGAYGTAVAATKALNGTSIEPKIMSTNTTHRSKGSRWVNAAIQNKEWTEADIVSDVAQYTDNTYLNSMLLGSPVITTPGGGTLSRNQQWTPSSFSGISPKIFTVENGGSVRAMRFPYGLCTGLGMNYDRKKGVTLKGDMIGWITEDGVTLTAGTNEVQTLSKTGTVTGGTYTLTWKGETTGNLNHSDNNATILAALNALPNIDSGDVTLGGGALPATGVTITFGGQYASQNVPLMTVTSGSLTGGGTYGIVETTPGVALTELGMQPIAGDEWDVYFDTTSGGIGGSKLTRVLSASWKISDLFGPVWVGNTTNTSWVAHVDLPPKTEVKFKLEANSSGMAPRTQLQTGDTRFIRFLCTGPIIEGSIHYKDQRDFAIKIMKISPFSDEDGVYAIEYTAEIAHDSTWGKALDWNQVNAITAVN